MINFSNKSVTKDYLISRFEKLDKSVWLIEDFLLPAGISLDQFNRLLVSEDSELKYTAQKIRDYFVARMLKQVQEDPKLSQLIKVKLEYDFKRDESVESSSKSLIEKYGS